jgi:hypothetical protein
MHIIYLDQNKWIELARVHAKTDTASPLVPLYEKLVTAVELEHILFPLSVTHVMETSKQNDPARRGYLAETQARLSKGCAYRSYTARLEAELHCAICRLLQIEWPALPPRWVIAPNFLQAFEPYDSMVSSSRMAQFASRLNRLMSPAEQYIDFMRNQDDSRRREIHKQLSSSLAEHVSRMERRRALVAGQPVDMRRRAYAVGSFMDNLERMGRIITRLGRSLDEVWQLGEDAVRSLVECVPTLDVESRMAARLESESRPLDPNDVRDIQWLYTAIPYSTHIVAEKAAISRACQAGLHEKYSVHLSRSLTDLEAVIGG